MNINSNPNHTLYDGVVKVNETFYKVCYDVPPKSTSDGIWTGQDTGRTPMKSFFPMFELQVLIIFVLTQMCRFLLKPLGLPSFIPQVLAGLIIGISFEIESLHPYTGELFPFGTHDCISAVSSVGFVLFIFIYGVQMDFSMITRTGNKAWAISIIGMLVPLFAGFIPRILFSDKLDAIRKSYGDDISVALGSHILSSFAVIASLLDELKIQNSELGRLALSSALVTDILSKILSTIGVTIVTNPDMDFVIRNLFSVLSFSILIPLICRPTMFWIIKHTPEGRPVKDSYIYIIISMVFVFGVIFVKIHQEFILGAFILGLSVPDGPPLGSALVKKLQFFATSFFLPVFVTTSVLKADFSMDFSASSVLITSLVVLGTHLVKIAACLIASLCCNLPLSDALSLALILNTKGVVEIGIYNGLYDERILDGETYGVMMISVVIISCIVQWCVKLLYDPSKKYVGYQKRNIMSLKPNSELRILATIHKQNHISPVTEFLDLCCPTTEDYIMVDVLHLIELVGRALPVFIHHGLQIQESSMSSSRRSYSDDVIMAFDIYKHENENAISVDTYTAISPAELMYEDVCNLALDKVASMIILPFHQRWSSDGGVESDDKKIRTLNLRVLEIAPCSVGILVTRASKGATLPDQSSSSSSSYTRLAIIYLGGGDDEEVLCIAKRAIKNPNTRLIVYHLVAGEYKAELEDLLEMEGGNEVLREVKNAENVRYEEILTNSGSETVSFLGEIVKEHDFFIVGRRHEIDSPQTEGLTAWSEFPELGVIGDFLSSPDLKSHASIFVVQQQLSQQTRHGWML